MKPTTFFRPLVLAALLASTFAAQAAITVYTSQAKFAEATSAPGIDTYSDFLVTGSASGPLSRTAGIYDYTGETTSGGFYIAGSNDERWLSSFFDTDTITLRNFSAGVQAVGGNFFASSSANALSDGEIALRAEDSQGTVFRSVFDANTTSFIGFVSTGQMKSISFRAVPGLPSGGGEEETFPPSIFPTLDNLVLAQGAVAPIPEPETYALMFAGLGLMAFVARRRRV